MTRFPVDRWTGCGTAHLRISRPVTPPCRYGTQYGDPPHRECDRLDVSGWQNLGVGPLDGWQGLDRDVAVSFGLTRREVEVLDAVVARLSNAEIAAKLFISE